MRLNALMLAGLCLLGYGCQQSQSQESSRQVDIDNGFAYRVGPAQSRDELTETASWTTADGGEVTRDADQAKVGKYSLAFRAKIDFSNGAGWPHMRHVFEPPDNWRGHNAIRFWLKVEARGPKADPARTYPIRCHIRLSGSNCAGLYVPRPAPGEWRQFIVSLSRYADKVGVVNHIGWFICESDFFDGDDITWHIDGVELVPAERQPSPPAPDGAQVLLRLGEPDWATLVDSDARELTGVAHIRTGSDCRLRADDTLLAVFHDVFGSFARRPASWKRQKKGGLNIPTRMVQLPLGTACPPDSTTAVPVRIPVSDSRITPGFFYVTLDLQRQGRSLLNGWVGCDDFYLRSAGETMLHTAMGHRLGTALYARDLLFGGPLAKARLGLPGTFDPLREKTYLAFAERHFLDLAKYGEHIEMGLSPLPFAAQALRRCGQDDRLAFLNWYIKVCADYIIEKQMRPDGACYDATCELLANYGAVLTGREECGLHPLPISTPQTAQRLKPLARVILYLQTVPGEQESVRRYLEAGRRITDFLVRNSTASLDGVDHVFAHHSITGPPENPMPKLLRPDAARRADAGGGEAPVYYPWIHSAVAYFAAAWAASGRNVPPDWDRALRNTATWTAMRMAGHGGFFDHKCDTDVRRFLGQYYAGEALVGHVLYANQIGDEAEARRAADAAKEAYDFLLERGGRGGTPFYTESLWAGPYLYWLFWEYFTHVGDHPGMRAWMARKDADIEVNRKWRDYFARGANADPTSPAGHTRLSLLGYTGCRLLSSPDR